MLAYVNFIASLVFWILAANGLWIIIFQSPLVRHLILRYAEEDLCSNKEVGDWLLRRGEWFWHNLWCCSVCQAVWTSAVAAIGFAAHAWGFLYAIVLAPISFLPILPVILWLQKRL